MTAPGKQKIAEFMSISDDRVDAARKTFETAGVTCTAARTFGCSVDIEAAAVDFRSAARAYADRMREHAAMVTDYVAVMTVTDAGHVSAASTSDK